MWTLAPPKICLPNTSSIFAGENTTQYVFKQKINTVSLTLMCMCVCARQAPPVSLTRSCT